MIFFRWRHLGSVRRTQCTTEPELGSRDELARLSAQNTMTPSEPQGGPHSAISVNSASGYFCEVDSPQRASLPRDAELSD